VKTQTWFLVAICLGVAPLSRAAAQTEWGDGPACDMTLTPPTDLGGSPQPNIRYTVGVTCPQQAEEIQVDGLAQYFDDQFNDWLNFQLLVRQDTQESWDVYNTTTTGNHDVSGNLSYPCAGSDQDSVRVRIIGDYWVEYDSQNDITHYQTFTTDEVVIKCGGH
jgi:hypothetical protein